jgi:hypothetical protein
MLQLQEQKQQQQQQQQCIATRTITYPGEHCCMCQVIPF